MISFKQTISITEVFHFKIPHLSFSFLPPVSIKITQCRSFNPISIFFPTLLWNTQALDGALIAFDGAD